MQRLSKTSLAEAQEVSFDLHRRTAKLELIRDKALELRLRIGAASDPRDMTPDLEWLKAEVALFKLACKGARV
jgi:hypothetical protein